MAKNWCFLIVVLEKIFESPLDSKEIQSFNSKGNQPWILIGKTVPEAGAPILWPPDMKSRLIGKDLDAWKDQGQEEKVVAEDEMVRYITNSVDMNLSKLQKIVEDRGTRHVAVYGVTKSWTQLSHWTTITANMENEKKCSWNINRELGKTS